MKRVLNLMKRGVKWYMKQVIMNGYVITPTGCIPIKE